MRVRVRGDGEGAEPAALEPGDEEENRSAALQAGAHATRAGREAVPGDATGSNAGDTGGDRDFPGNRCWDFSWHVAPGWERYVLRAVETPPLPGEGEAW